MAFKSCVFDIETFNLDANFGVVLCAVLKEQEHDPVVFRFDRADPKAWKSRRSDDSRLVLSFAKALSEFPIWTAHNGSRFDVPYINTRLLKHNLPPLPSPKAMIDPLQLARNKLRMSWNSLEQLAGMLGCNSKTPVVHEVWCKAAFDGCGKALDTIVEHCIEDVLTLERVALKLGQLSTGFNHYGSAR